ncbi:hypothetical protein [Cupriavidus basilensis]|uniref:hypothetical protein n=1 Tax=Cupriavidus basilensis TaxID=68895 RepID=UPI00157A9B22|nr:hypothetical protein [Cupriavidus basilensis]NUA26304.1 hypothetical protein [Cupriavidus basilensis]
MADKILETHPLRALPKDSALALVLELENPFLMSLERLEEIIEAEPVSSVRAYLFGLYDMRRAAIYAGGR